MKAPCVSFIAACQLLGGIFVAVGFVMYDLARPDALARLTGAEMPSLVAPSPIAMHSLGM
jgi:hypothetical protein